jgi:PAT family beta-lactamase induction signal transducer AmpG
MSTPFFLASGFTQAQVGVVLGGVGLGATILGTLAGTAAMARLELGKALRLFGISQAVCGLLFWHLASVGRDLLWMNAAVVSESFFIGMGSAALVAFLTRVCDARFSATQFALLSSLMAASRDPLTAPSGYLVAWVGWPAFFLLCLAASLPGLFLLPVALRAVREDAA